MAPSSFVLPTPAAFKRAPGFSLLSPKRRREALEYLADGDEGSVASILCAQAAEAQQPDEADRLMRWALEIDPCSTDAFPLVVKQALDGGDVKGARAIVERARARAPLFIDNIGYESDARVLVAEGRLDEAEAVCRDVLKRAPKNDVRALYDEIRERRGKAAVTAPLDVSFFEMIELVSSGKVVEALKARPALAKLVERGASRCTLLHFAVEQGAHVAVRSLLACGAKVDRRSGYVSAWEDSLAPLHLAAKRGDVKATKLLLSAGADADVASGDGQRPLHFAAAAGHLRVVKALLDAGATPDPRTRHPDGPRQTPLMYAASLGRKAVVEALLGAGADRRAKAGKHTAADLARMNKHAALARHLEQA